MCCFQVDAVGHHTQGCALENPSNSMTEAIAGQQKATVLDPVLLVTQIKQMDKGFSLSSPHTCRGEGRLSIQLVSS